MEGDEEETKQDFVYADVTQFLRKTSAGMVPGQMIHGETFSLHEAMSALELMDPKMDSGMNATKPISADALLENVTPLTIPELIAVMDELVACEISWINGHSIGHTLFTCLYLHRPQHIASPILKAYVDILLKTAQLIRQAILDADIYEDEDFFSGKFQFDLREEMTKEECFSQLHAVSERLEAQVLQASGKGKPGEEVPPLQDDPARELELCTALLDRLRFRKAWFNLHFHLATAKPNANSLKPCAKLISTALQHLNLISHSLRLADPAPIPVVPDPTPGAQHKPKTSATTPLTKGFSMDIAKNLVSSGPPRDVRIVTREEGYSSLQALLNQFNALLNVPSCLTFEDIQLFFRTFSLMNPNILTRSHLLLLSQTDQDFLGHGPLTDLLKDSFHRVCSSTIPHTGSPEFTMFVGRVARPIAVLFRSLCENRTRQRRKLPKHMGDWSILQAEAIGLDQKVERDNATRPPPQLAPCKHPFFSWIFDQTVQMLTHHTLLGFELDLYMPREYPLALWHLERLFDLRLQNLNLAYRPVEKKGEKKSKKIINPVAVSHPRTAQFLIMVAHLYLTKGLLQALFVFARLGCPLPPINPEHRKNWFSNRFVLMDMVNQPPMSIEMFDQTLDYYNNKVTIAAVYKLATENFSQCTQHLTKALAHEQPPSPAQAAVLEQLKGVAAGNSAELQRHIKGLAQKDALRMHRISFHFTLSKHFPLISVELPSTSPPPQSESKAP